MRRNRVTAPTDLMSELDSDEDDKKLSTQQTVLSPSAAPTQRVSTQKTLVSPESLMRFLGSSIMVLAAAKDKPAPKRQSEEKGTDKSKALAGREASASPCANDDGSVVKCGTFGNQQGLRVAAIGGPFYHTMKV